MVEDLENIAEPIKHNKTDNYNFDDLIDDVFGIGMGVGAIVLGYHIGNSLDISSGNEGHFLRDLGMICGGVGYSILRDLDLGGEGYTASEEDFEN